ncbi:MAG: hypothetical protein ABIO86_03555 [Sphingomonas sp.]
MVFDQDRARQLDAYIAALKSGKPADAAAQIMGVESGLDLKLNAYGVRPMWASAALNAAQLSVGDVSTRALNPGEAAVMPALMRSRGGVDAATAQGVAAQARTLAQPYPADAGAQNELAAAEYDAGDYAASEAAADRALAADPGSVEAMIHKGRALAAIAAKSPGSGAGGGGGWAAARRWYLAASKADPLYFYPARSITPLSRPPTKPPPPSRKRRCSTPMSSIR